MKKIIAVGSLVAALVVLVFASIAAAQDSTDQGSSDPNSSSADQAQSPTAGQQETTTSGQATPTQNTPTVRILANSFDPAQLEVTSGTPVTFVNDDSVAHTVSLEGLFDSPEIPAGYSYPVTLDGSGTVTYHDKANPQMQGTLTIGGASGGESTVPNGSNSQETTTPQQPTQQSGTGGY